MEERPAPALQLTLELARAEAADDPHAFLFGPQTYLLRGEGGGVSTLQLDFSAELVARLSALRQPDRDPALQQQLGDLLRRFLGAGWSAQEARLRQAVQEGRTVLLHIRSAAAELYTLPWELLTLQATGQHLGELPAVLLRYEWPETASREPAATAPPETGRILFAWSAAAGAVPAAEHQAAIAAACQAGGVPFAPQRDVLANVSCGRLVRALHAAKQEGSRIAVLHLLCHGAGVGSTFGLVFDGESEGDGARTVDAARLRQLLAPHADTLRLVVLSACDSGNAGELGNRLGSTAQTLHRGGLAQVVASRYPLSVAGSVRFSQTFYRKLLAGPDSVEQALLAARRDLASHTAQLDWASLQLYAHAEDGEDSRPIALRPYRGLLSFQPEHQRFFFGRDREVAELVADFSALQASGRPRLLAVDGASGTGKSSVLFAGALPHLLPLLGPTATLLRLRPGSTPEQTLSEQLSTRKAGTPTLLVIDQFEELFTHVADAQTRQAFGRRLWQLAQATGSGVSVILTLRSDFVGRCGELALDDSGLRLDRVLYDAGHRVSVAQMNRAQLMEVIEKPAARVGLQLEAGLAQRLLSEVEHEPGGLPLLADTLDLLWLHRRKNSLTQAAYDALGGVTGALHGRADQLILSLPLDEQRQARGLLVRLGSSLSEPGGGMRLRVPLASRRPQDPTLAGAFDRALARLVEARLLVLDRDGSEQTVEVAHEALLRRWPRLSAWVAQDREQLRQAETVEAWAQQASASQTLLAPAQLLYAEGVVERCSEMLSQPARELIGRSRHAQNLADERDRFARDSLRMLAVQGLAADPTRQAAILREVESADPRDVPGWLAAGLELLHHHALTIAELSGHSGPVACIDISADGKWVLSGGADRTARLWPLGGATEPILLTGHTDAVISCGFSPDGRWILTASHDGTARIWPRDGKTAPRVLRGHSDRIWHAAWSPDSSQVATASADGTARLWRVAESQPALVLAGHKDEVLHIAWSPDGSRVATASADATARVWSTAGRGAPTVLSGHQDQVSAVQFDPSTSNLLTVSEDGTARLWPLRGRGAPRVFQPTTGRVAFARLSPAGTWLAQAQEAGEISISEVGEGREPVVHPAQGAALTSLDWISEAQLVATYQDGVVRIWPASRTALPLILRGHGNRANCAAYSPKKKRLATASIDGIPRVWDLARPDLQSTRFAEPREEDGFLFAQEAGEPPAADQKSPDLRLLAKPCPDGSVRIQPAEGGEPVIQLPSTGSAIRRMLFSPDGSRLAVLSADGCARIYPSQGGTPVILSGPSEPIRCLAFSPDGERIVIGGASWQARVLRSDGRGTPLILRGHSQPVVLAAFSPEGRRVLTIDGAGELFIWDDSGRGERLLEPRRVEAIAITADGQQVACIVDESTAQVLQLELHPRQLVARLWRATPLCLSPEERQRYLREPRELASRNHQAALTGPPGSTDRGSGCHSPSLADASHPLGPGG